jgi:hypothetical protein
MLLREVGTGFVLWPGYGVGGDAGGGGGPRDVEAEGRKARESGRNDVVVVLKY